MKNKYTAPELTIVQFRTEIISGLSVQQSGWKICGMKCRRFRV